MHQWPAAGVAHEYRQLQPRAEINSSVARAAWRRGAQDALLFEERPARRSEYHLASGASSISGTSNFTYQVASVSVAEASHTTNLNVVTWANNYIDPTGGGGGTSTTYKRAWDIHPNRNMYCQSPVRLTREY